jgi:hypothetical protein
MASHTCNEPALTWNYVKVLSCSLLVLRTASCSLPDRASHEMVRALLDAQSLVRRRLQSVLVRSTTSSPAHSSRPFLHRLRQQSGLEIHGYPWPNPHIWPGDPPWKGTCAGSTFVAGAGILTCRPSTTHFCLVFCGVLTLAVFTFPCNLRLSACRIFTCIIVTHTGILTRTRSSTPYGMPSTRRATLFYRVRCRTPAASVSSLFPIIYGATLLDQ